VLQFSVYKLSSYFYSVLYQFQKLGDDDNEPEWASTSYPSFGMAEPAFSLPHAFFRPRNLENLALADELESLHPILDAKVMKIMPNSDAPQIFVASGRGARSTFKILRHGLEAEESVSSDLPGIPNAVWTTKKKEDGKQ
jgi:splicing factor 3B subunit 3